MLKVIAYRANHKTIYTGSYMERGKRGEGKGAVYSYHVASAQFASGRMQNQETVESLTEIICTVLVLRRNCLRNEASLT